LASFWDEEEYNAMQDLNDRVNTYANQDIDVWIGLNDLDTPQVFVWSDGSVSSYRPPWAPRQPDNFGTQQCVRYTNWLGTRALDDFICTENRPFFCGRCNNGHQLSEFCGTDVSNECL
jgi:hypothetical protein